MAVFYGVPKGKFFVIAGPADVTVRGGEHPMIVDDLADFTDNAPAITALEPNTAESGSEDVVMAVTGTGFTDKSVIVFGSNDEPTTLTAEGTLTTGVKPSLFAPAAVPVTVRNGPARSGSLDFTFTEPVEAGATKRGKAHA
jgi:IPT/TIG domain-containing protein